MARPAKGQAPKKGKKNRKHGRNKNVCLRYRNEGRWERNKKRRLRRHLKNQPNDQSAARELANM